MATTRRLGLLWCLAVASAAGLVVSLTLLVTQSGAAPVGPINPARPTGTPTQSTGAPVLPTGPPTIVPSATAVPAGVPSATAVSSHSTGPVPGSHDPQPPLPVTGTSATTPLLATGGVLIGSGALLMVMVAGARRRRWLS